MVFVSHHNPPQLRNCESGNTCFDGTRVLLHTSFVGWNVPSIGCCVVDPWSRIHASQRVVLRSSNCNNISECPCNSSHHTRPHLIQDPKEPILRCLLAEPWIPRHHPYLPPRKRIRTTSVYPHSYSNVSYRSSSKRRRRGSLDRR